MTIIAFLLEILAITISYTKKFYYISAFLLYALLSDVIKIALQSQYILAPVPYSGMDVALFQIHNIIYLSLPIVLLYLIMHSYQSSLKNFPLSVWVLSSILVICIYPSIRGMALLNIFSAYYLAIYCICFILVIIQIKRKMNFDHFFLFLATLSGTCSVIFSLLWDWSYSILMNSMLYIVIIVVSLANHWRKKLILWHCSLDSD
jgi:hypothetical protein